jgi:hypothetical protein
MARLSLRLGIVVAAVALAAGLPVQAPLADEPRLVSPQGATPRPAAPATIDRTRITLPPQVLRNPRVMQIIQRVDALIAIRAFLPVEEEPECAPPVDVSHWCQELVTKVCGAEDQCSSSPGCEPATIFLERFCAAEGEEREEMLITCLISLEDEIIFNPCGG